MKIEKNNILFYYVIIHSYCYIDCVYLNDLLGNNGFWESSTSSFKTLTTGGFNFMKTNSSFLLYSVNFYVVKL